MHTCTCNLQTHKNAQSGVGKTKSIKKWCRVFNSSLSQFKITQIVYLGGVEIPADLRKELSQICKDMKLPAPFIAGPGSVNDPLFRQIWSNYTSDREDQKGDEPLTSAHRELVGFCGYLARRVQGRPRTTAHNCSMIAPKQLSPRPFLF